MLPLLPAVIAPLQFGIDVFEHVLLFFHDQIGLGWGLSIIFLTIAVRAVLLPLTFKQFKSMQAMQTLSPKMKELQAKYKDDRQRLNQEMMKLYQEHQVNPFASCLPVVAQAPVFISLFYMLRKDLKQNICGHATAHHQSINQYLASHPGTTLVKTGCQAVQPGSGKFLFVGDLTNTASGVTLAVLLILYVGSQLGSSVLMSATVDPTQRRIMLFLPFIFTAFIFRFPAGAIVYWITTNLWTVGQQYFVRRSIGMPVPGRPGTGQAVGLPGLGGAVATVTDEPAPAAKASAKSTRAKATPVTANAGGSPAGPPPRPPRKKKKQRSGRRR